MAVLAHYSIAGVHYRQERINCGKRSCRSCPHGPYWYAYWRSKGRLRKRYIGGKLPPDVVKLLAHIERMHGTLE